MIIIWNKLKEEQNLIFLDKLGSEGVRWQQKFIQKWMVNDLIEYE